MITPIIIIIIIIINKNNKSNNMIIILVYGSAFAESDIDFTSVSLGQRYNVPQTFISS